MLNIQNHKTIIIFSLFSVALLLIAEPSFAQTLPWEAPLTKVKDSLSGPVATGVAVIGFFVAGMVLVFGQDLSGFGRTVIMIILAVSFLKLGADFLTVLFGN